MIIIFFNQIFFFTLTTVIITVSTIILILKWNLIIRQINSIKRKQFYKKEITRMNQRLKQDELLQSLTDIRAKIEDEFSRKILSRSQYKSLIKQISEYIKAVPD